MALVVGVTFAIATLSEAQRPEIFTATARIQLSSATPEAFFFGQRPQRLEGKPINRAARAARLIHGADVGLDAGRRLTGRKDITLAGRLGASPTPSGTVAVKGGDTDPRIAAAIANAGAAALVAKLVSEDRERVREAIKEYRSELRKLRNARTWAALRLKVSLERSLVSLRVFDRSPSSARVASSANPPTEPEELRNARVAPAVTFAATIAILLVLLLDRIGSRARGAGRLAAAAGVPLLTAVPSGRRQESRRASAYDLLRATVASSDDGGPASVVAVVPVGRRATAPDVVAGLAEAFDRAGRPARVAGGPEVVPGAEVVLVAAPGPEHASGALEAARRADVVVLSARAGDAGFEEIAGAAAALEAIDAAPLGLVVLGAVADEAPELVVPQPRRWGLRSSRGTA